MAATDPERPAEDRLTEAFCQTCGRATYLAPGVDPFCPVCSSPLVELSSSSEPEAV